MMKIAELDGELLNDWCARANGWWKVQDESGQWHWMSQTLKGNSLMIKCEDFRPTTDFAQGGPLLERGKISVEAPLDIGHDIPHVAWSGSHFKTNDDGKRVPVHSHVQEGYGYLRAGMRCWIAKNFGFEVPDKVDWTKERDWDD